MCSIIPALNSWSAGRGGLSSLGLLCHHPGSLLTSTQMVIPFGDAFYSQRGAQTQGSLRWRTFSSPCDLISVKHSGEVALGTKTWDSLCGTNGQEGYFFAQMQNHFPFFLCPLLVLNPCLISLTLFDAFSLLLSFLRGGENSGLESLPPAHGVGMKKANTENP